MPDVDDLQKRIDAVIAKRQAEADATSQGVDDLQARLDQKIQLEQGKQQFPALYGAPPPLTMPDMSPPPGAVIPPVPPPPAPGPWDTTQTSGNFIQNAGHNIVVGARKWGRAAGAYATGAIEGLPAKAANWASGVPQDLQDVATIAGSPFLPADRPGSLGSQQEADAEARLDQMYGKPASDIGHGAVDPLLGPDSMLGHGMKAVAEGKTVDFLKTVPSGIRKETEFNTFGQALNIIAATGTARMALSAAGPKLLGIADTLETNASQAYATGDMARGAAIMARAEKVRAVGQAMNRSAISIHRTMTGGPVGDYARDAVATAVEKVFPGTGLAKSLRINADYQKAVGMHLKSRGQAQREAAAGADYDAAKAAAREGAIPINQGTPTQVTPEDLAAADPTGPFDQSLLPGSAEAPEQIAPVVAASAPAAAPTPAVPPVQEAAAPTTPAAPSQATPAPPVMPPVDPTHEPAVQGLRDGIHTGDTPAITAAVNALHEAGATPAQVDDHVGSSLQAAAATVPEIPPAHNVSKHGFMSDYQVKYNDLMHQVEDYYSKAVGTPLDPENRKAAEQAIHRRLIDELDPTTGLLNRPSLVDTLNRAVEHVADTGEHGIYFHVNPEILPSAGAGASVDAAAMARPLADYLSGEMAGLNAHVSFYSPGPGQVAGIVVGARPRDVEERLDAARRDHDAWQKQSGEVSPISFTWGASEILPGMGAEEIAKDAAGGATAMKPYIGTRLPAPIEETAPSTGHAETAPTESSGTMEAGVKVVKGPGAREREAGNETTTTRPTGDSGSGQLAPGETGPGEDDGSVRPVPSGDAEGAGAGDRRGGGSDRGGDLGERDSGTDRSGLSAPAEEGPATGGSVEPEGVVAGWGGAAPADSPAAYSPGPQTTNFRITDPGAIGDTTQGQKYNDLTAALRMLKRIEARGDLATPEEQAVLIRFPGWGWVGGYGDLLNPKHAERNSGQHYRYRELTELLTDEELAAARRSTLNSHYTTPAIIEHIYAAVTQLGFDGGRVLEPSAGIGLFLGMVPPEWGHTPLHAVEMDNLTGRILQQLFPKAETRIAPFQDTKYPDNYFDLVVGNIPFGNFPVKDPSFTKSGLSLLTSRVHNYFLARSLQVLRPGGVMAVITSEGSLNARDQVATATRAYLAEHAQLLGAIRLPNTAFARNASTEVTTDILFFQKRTPGMPAGPAFADVVNVGTEEAPIMVNEYFVAHPEMALGTHSLSGRMRGHASYALLPHPGDMIEHLSAAVKHLPASVYIPAPLAEAAQAADAPRTVGKRERTGSLVIGPNGEVSQRVNGVLVSRDLTPKERAVVASFVALREAFIDIIEAQRADLTDAELAVKQKTLRDAYDGYVKKHGPLHKAHTSKLWRDDPDAPNVRALENWDPDKKVVTSLAGIFTDRVITPNTVVAGVDAPKDALIASLRAHGRVDLPYMSEISDLPERQIFSDLNALSVVFLDPVSGKHVMSDAYGSGNVRAALASAKNAAKIDPETYGPNVAFLETRQPVDLMPGQITAYMGAQWIPSDVYVQFLEHLLQAPVPGNVTDYSAPSAKWKVNAFPAVFSTRGGSTWGVKYESLDTGDERTIYVHDLIEDILNAKAPTVFEKVGPKGDRRTVLNKEATVAAEAKAMEIKDEWKDWVMSDHERAQRLAEIYNREVNVYQDQEFDGSHLELPGIIPDWTMRPHQLNAIWRMMTTPAVLLAHGVGTGKTATFIAAAMEMRRIGIRNKIVINAFNGNLTQVIAEARRLYPAARIHAVEDNNFAAPVRQEWLAKAAANNWDIIIMAHSHFEDIPNHPDVVIAHFSEEITKYRNFLYAYRKEAPTDKEDFTVKQVEAMILRMEEKVTKLHEKLKVRQSDSLYWEDLGVDQLIVDESHEYKNLAFMTSRDGLNSSGNQKTTDMYIKVQQLLRGGGGVTFATGTPITNSISEMYSILRYLAPDILKEQKIEHFDAWAQQYAEQVTELERNAAGEWVKKPRFTKWSNKPELMRMYKSVADQVNGEDVEALVRPRLTDINGKFTDEPIIITTQVNPAQRAHFIDQNYRAKHLPYPPEKGDDTMLSVSTDGRHVSLDVRTRDVVFRVQDDGGRRFDRAATDALRAAHDYPDSKINQLVAAVHAEYSRPGFAKDKRTQIIFLDLGTPSSAGEKKEMSFDLYADIKKKLVARGVPAHEIEFIQDYEGDKRGPVYERVRQGIVRILMGSRGILGVGVNVQTRLSAIHQVDPTWRPDQLEQADGRILRHGNLFHSEGVRIYHHVAEDTFDGFMWNRITQKKGPIDQITYNDDSVREVEEEQDEKFSVEQIQAIASGNPEFTELVKLNDKIKSMESLEKTHRTQRIDLQNRYSSMTKSQIPAAERNIVDLQRFADYLNQHKPDKFAMTIGGETVTVYKDAGARLAEIGIKMGRWDAADHVGDYHGLEVYVEQGEQIQYVYKLLPDNLPKEAVVTPHNGGGYLVTTPRAKVMLIPKERGAYKIDGHPAALTALLEADNGQGNMARIDNKIRGIYSDIQSLEREVAKMQAEAPKVLEEAQRPFKQADDLKKMRARQRELEGRLGDMSNSSGTGFGAGSARPAAVAAALEDPEDDEEGEEPGPKQQNPRRGGGSSSSVAVQEADPADTGDYPPGSTLNAGINPGFRQLYDEDLLPAAQAAGTFLSRGRAAVYRLFSPASASRAAGMTARILREKNAEMVQRDEMARRALIAASKYFDTKMDSDERIAFTDKVERGGYFPTPSIESLYAGALRALLDDAKNEFQALGTGKLDHWIMNYMPHIWKDPKRAEDYYGGLYGRRPMNGSGAFLKQRSYEFTVDGIANGLVPITDNPVQLVLLKLHEMNRYIMAQKAIGEFKENGLVKFVRAPGNGAHEDPPDGYVPLRDRSFQVWGPPHIEMREAFDAKMDEALTKLLADLGVEDVRKPKIGGKGWGRSDGDTRVTTKFAGPLSVKTHELGHILDERYKLWEYLSQPGLRVSGVTGARVKILQELKDLADLRFEGKTPTPAYQRYVRQQTEKVANAIEALIHAPELMEAVAPTVKKRLERFIKEHPELHPLRDIKPGLVLDERTMQIPTGGLIQRGQYWAAPQVADVIDNYLSPGLRGHVVYDLLRGAGNVMNQAQLGLSAFHFTFTCIDAAVSKFALGTKQIGQGLEDVIRGAVTHNPARASAGASRMARAPGNLVAGAVPGIAPVLTLLKGSKVLEEYLNPGSMPAQFAEIVDMLIAGGGRVSQDSFYTNDAVKGLYDELAKVQARMKSGNAIGVVAHGAAVLPRMALAAVELAAKPLMEYWVPRLKLGIIYDLGRDALDNLPPGTVLDRDELRRIAASIVDEADNRMGQMIYDNLFWNRVVKDSLMLGTRSVGWNSGTLRIAAGGAADIASIPRRLREDDPAVTDRIAYLFALPVIVALFAATYQYLHTREMPKDTKDLLHPRTGRMKKDGKPERVDLPTYMKDVVSYSKDPFATVGHKVHPLVSTLLDIWQDKDFYGNQVRNADAPLVEQLTNSFGYAGTQLVPFSGRNALRNLANDDPAERQLEALMGIIPAPADVDRTAAEKLMLKDILKTMPAAPRTRDAADKAAQKRQNVEEGRSGDRLKALAEIMRERAGGEITRRQAHEEKKDVRLDARVVMFKHLSAPDAVDVYEQANAEERTLFSHYLARKAHGQTPSIRERIAKALGRQ